MTLPVTTPRTTATVVRMGDTRQTETPNASMTTLAAPSLGQTTTLALWRVRYPAGATGPLHVMDSEQVWALESGSASCTVDGARHDLAAGDTIRIAGGAERQITTRDGARFVVCGHANAVARTEANPEGVVPPWIA